LGSAVLVRLLRRRKPRAQSAPPPARVEAKIAPSAYANALTRLREIEQAEWARQGGVDRHYAAVADTIRRYLNEAHDIPALTSTTGELGDLLPGEAAAQRWRCLSLLREADMVKFARLRPSAESATRYTAEARAVLAEWVTEASGSTDLARRPQVPRTGRRIGERGR